jgi:nucleoid DNA-binding protein
MNFKDFSKEVYSYVEDETVTQKQTDDVIESFVEALKEQLSKKEDVKITNLGIFKYNERAARTARNPTTGASIQVPAKAAVSFKPSKQLKDLMNEIEVD